MDYVLQLLSDRQGLTAYLLVFGILFLCGLGMPLPEDVPLIAGGYAAYLGKANIYLMVLTGMLGVMTGDLIIYSAGRRWGRKVLSFRIFKGFFTEERMERVQGLFSRHGDKAVFMARFIVGLRPAVFASAGMLGMPVTKFILYDGLAAVISVPVWVLLAYFMGGQIDWLLMQAENAKHIAFVVIVLVISLVIGLKYHRSIRRYFQSSPETEAPSDPKSQQQPMPTTTSRQSEQEL